MTLIEQAAKAAQTAFKECPTDESKSYEYDTHHAWIVAVQAALAVCIPGVPDMEFFLQRMADKEKDLWAEPVTQGDDKPWGIGAWLNKSETPSEDSPYFISDGLQRVAREEQDRKIAAAAQVYVAVSPAEFIGKLKDLEELAGVPLTVEVGELEEKQFVGHKFRTVDGVEVQPDVIVE